ncbi:MAG: hypothetical protein IPO81_28450 [Kouleothrix sp.]|nr:hypothetical protein [Kouleothrix sp.]
MTLRLVQPVTPEHGGPTEWADCPDDSSDESDSAHMLEGGWSMLYVAVALWDIIGSEKGRKLHHLLKDTIEVPPEDWSYVMTRAQVAQVLQLLEGLEQALSQIADERWRARPAAVDQVVRLLGDQVISWEENGRLVYSLAEPISSALRVEAFLKEAQRLGCQVMIE